MRRRWWRPGICGGGENWLYLGKTLEVELVDDLAIGSRGESRIAPAPLF